MRLSSLGFDRFSGRYLWALLVIVFAVWVPDLLFTPVTAHFIASHQAVVCISRSRCSSRSPRAAYDLSIGSYINLCCVLVAVLQRRQGVPTAIAVTVGVGRLIGFISGFGVVKLRISSLHRHARHRLDHPGRAADRDGRQPADPVETSWLDLTLAIISGFRVVFVCLARRPGWPRSRSTGGPGSR